MKEIRICSMDSDRVVLESIMEGVNGLIRAKNEESAPSASTNTQSAAIAQIAAELEDGVRIANIGGAPSAEQLSKWARQLRAL